MGKQPWSSLSSALLTVPRLGFHDPSEYYLLLQKISLLSDSKISFTNFHVYEAPPYLYQPRMIVQFEVNGKPVDFYLRPGGQRGAFDQSFFSFVNRTLIESQINQRIYFLDSSPESLEDVDVLYYLLLSPRQYQDLEQEGVFQILQISQLWATESILDTISSIEQIDLLYSALNSAKNTIVRDILRSRITDVLSIIRGIPSLIYDFDIECISDGKEYINLVYETCQITHGVLNPRSVELLGNISNAKPKELRLFFLHSGREYVQSLSWNGKWADLSYLDALERAGKDIQADAHFRFIDHGAQDVYLMYLTDTQVEALQQLSLPFR